jgi:tetratricopeptide (TPR) repeat protein
LLAQKNYGEAEQALQEAIRLDPKYGPAYSTLGRLYGESKDISRLQQLSRQIFGLELTTDEEYNAHVIIADGYQSAKLYEEATDETQ